MHASDFGNNALRGGQGRDELHGWQGNDTLDGGNGGDPPGPPLFLAHVAVGRVPDGDRAAALHAAAEVERDAAALASVDLRGNEPGRNPLGGGDRVPHLLRRGGDLRLRPRG